MYELVAYGQLQHQENGREVAMEGSTIMAHEDHDTGPYVVRDLSWELARFLDAEGLPVSTSATPDGPNGSSPQHE